MGKRELILFGILVYGGSGAACAENPRSVGTESRNAEVQITKENFVEVVAERVIEFVGKNCADDFVVGTMRLEEANTGMEFVYIPTGQNPIKPELKVVIPISQFDTASSLECYVAISNYIRRYPACRQGPERPVGRVSA